jgi:hypothetical protein
MALADLVPFASRGPGLSESELAVAQEQAGVAFPPDLCELLSMTLPTGRPFPDWRTRPREALETFTAQIIDGIEFDVQNNVVWRESWGARPEDTTELHEAIVELVRDAPTLIPIYEHRAIPDEPNEPGNPVFSIVQTDIIVYGHDLADYLKNEFGPRGRPRPASAPRTIRFWTDLIEAT